MNLDGFSPSPYPKDTGWDRESELCWFVGGGGMSAFITSSSSSASSVEEGSSRTCVGAVPRDLSLYDIMSGIR